VDHTFKIVIRVGTLDHNVFNEKLSSLVGNISEYSFALFMVISTTYKEPQHIYGGVYTVGGHNEEYFTQHGW
jgi:hypothetical protein